MKNIIKENIGNPEKLEKLYRTDRKNFEKAFLELYPEIEENEISRYWKARIDAEKIKPYSFNTLRNDILFLIITCLIAGFLLKIPAIFKSGIDKEIYFLKNAGIIAFAALSLYYFMSSGAIKLTNILVTTLIFLFSTVYVNLLPSDKSDNTFFLVCLHLPLMLWFLYGLVFTGFNLKERSGWIGYLRHNGELVVLFAVIAAAGGILTGVTIGLFESIGIDAEEFYFENIVFWGIVSAPVVATFLIRYFPAITNKIPPVIAGIFSPLILLTLAVFLVVVIFSGRSLFSDRDFLLVFNLMLLGVTVVIVFSVIEPFIYTRYHLQEGILLALVALAILTDLIALSAIIYRLGEYGFTPNRTAVLGSNLLILVNLLLIGIDLFKVILRNNDIEKVKLTIVNYLPVYALWAVTVVFIFPLIFGF